MKLIQKMIELVKRFNSEYYLNGVFLDILFETCNDDNVKNLEISYVKYPGFVFFVNNSMFIFADNNIYHIKTDSKETKRNYIQDKNIICRDFNFDYEELCHGLLRCTGLSTFVKMKRTRQEYNIENIEDALIKHDIDRFHYFKTFATKYEIINMMEELVISYFDSDFDETYLNWLNDISVEFISENFDEDSGELQSIISYGKILSDVIVSNLIKLDSHDDLVKILKIMDLKNFSCGEKLVEFIDSDIKFIDIFSAIEENGQMTKYLFEDFSTLLSIDEEDFEGNLTDVKLYLIEKAKSYVDDRKILI